MTYRIQFSSPDAKSIDLVQLCKDMDSCITSEDVLLKDDTATTLRLLETGIGKLVIKRYNTKNTWHKVRRNFQTSRAVNCRKMSLKFMESGIQVPEQVGVVQHTTGPFLGRSWFVSRFVDNEPLLKYLEHNQDGDSVQFVSDRVAGIFRALQENRMSHGDMKATNILVHGNELVMIDLDSARQHVSRAWHKRSLDRDKRRFLANWNSWPDMKRHFAEVLAANVTQGP